VRFEGHANWTGGLAEMELVEPRAEGKHAAPWAARRAAAAAAAAAGRPPFDERPGSSASSAGLSHHDGADTRRPIALRAGWVLGATALAVTAQGGGTNVGPKGGDEPLSPEEGSARTRAATARGVKRGQVLRQLGGAVALLLAFFWTLGARLTLTTGPSPSPNPDPNPNPSPSP
jgi:hypothetical protein